MVIQRNLKSLCDYQRSCNNNNNSNSENILQQTTSDESNNMNQMITTSKMLFSHQADVKKFVTTMEMANDVLNELKKKYLENESSIEAKTINDSERILQALELLRINIQSAFDKEIDGIVKKYLDIYFQPAFENIKHNLNGSCGNVEILNIMKCSLIENSKYQYNTKTNQRHNVLLFTGGNISNTEQTTTDQTDQTISTQDTQLIATQRNNKFINSSTPKSGVLKRSLVVTTNDSTLPTKRTVIVQKSTTSPADNTISKKIPTQRRQIYWHTANISTETYFVLDLQANQAFGFNPDGRERLASKHPELIRYLPDGQDRDWLVQQKIIPSQNRSSRFLLLVYDEVLTLGNSDLYKNRENFNLEVLHPFTVPYFTIQKMKTFFIDLNIKSRGLITNSFTSNIINVRPIGDSKGDQCLNEAFSLSTTNIKLGTSSQLRNALLQASQRAVAENKVVEINTNKIENQLLVADSTLISSTATEIVDITQQQKQQHIIAQTTKSPNILLTSVLKPKDKSALSSSHATLTALLTSNFSKGNYSNFTKNNEKFQTKQKQP